GQRKANAPDFLELDHLWPSAYGGDSVQENLLPSCQFCNRKKAEMICWEWIAAHSIVLGPRSTQETLNELPTIAKIALHRRAAFALARGRRVTLSQAFQELGAWTSLRPIEQDDTADFFNLEIHDTAVTDTPFWRAS